MYDENKHISLMENFNRNKFQWVKTNDKSRLGKVVTCVDIVPQGNTFVAKFDDSSSVDIRKITSDLLMITADMQPLSKEEVMSINGPSITTPIGVAGAGPIKLPPELQKEADAMRAEAAAMPKPEPQTIAQPQQERRISVSSPKSNMFAVFNSEETQISLNISVKLPDKKLLKMMYASAEDKDKFIGELSDFIMDQINKEVVSESIISTIAPAPAKKAAKSE